MSKIKQIRETIGLLNSMVLSGEQHSNKSKKQLHQAIENLDSVYEEETEDVIEGELGQLFMDCGDNKLINISNLNRDHYEEFLETMYTLSLAYISINKKISSKISRQKNQE